MEHVKEVLGWTKEKVWGKLLYVFGYGKNWWKSDGKLLIFIMCLQKEKEKKRKRKEIQSYIVKREEMKSWKKKCTPKKYMN